MWREVVGGVATVLALAQVIPYLVSILRGRTRPSLTSYLIWAAIECLGAAAAVATLGLAPASWPRVAFAITGLLVLALTIRHGHHTPVTRFELASLAAAAVGAACWMLLGTPVVSLLAATGVSGIAYATTIRKQFTHPGTENRAAWVMTSIAAALNLIILTNPTAAALPMLVTLAGSATVTALTYRPSQTRALASGR